MSKCSWLAKALMHAAVLQSPCNFCSLSDYVTVYLCYYSALEDLMDRSESESGSGSSSILQPPGMETVTLLQGESFLIPCDVSLIATPSSIDWYRNETLTASSAVC